MKRLVRLALQTHLVPGLPSIPVKVWRALEPVASRSPDDIRSWAAQFLEPAMAEAVNLRLDALAQFEARLDQFGSAGGWVTADDDAAYPRLWIERFAASRPPVLFGLGSRDLLNERAVGIVGSREADDACLAMTRQVADLAVQCRFAVASGGAKGVDREAAKGALASGGATVAICSDRLSAAAKPFVDAPEGSWCVASPFAPDAGFSVGNAMARNRLIYGLAKLTVVMASAEGSGGTWAGAEEALRTSNGRVAVWMGPGVPAGNRALVDRGALGFVELEQLEQMLYLPPAGQGGLFDEVE